jgi:hypothetical protein
MPSGVRAAERDDCAEEVGSLRPLAAVPGATGAAGAAAGAADAVGAAGTADVAGAKPSHLVGRFSSAVYTRRLMRYGADAR